MRSDEPSSRRQREMGEWRRFIAAEIAVAKGMLKEVELFPEDFDGVLAGAPAWW